MLETYEKYYIYILHFLHRRDSFKLSFTGMMRGHIVKISSGNDVLCIKIRLSHSGNRETDSSTTYFFNFLFFNRRITLENNLITTIEIGLH